VRRRDFIKVIGTAVAWPFAARAQQPMPVIGYLSPGSQESDVLRLTPFRKGLSETGYIEGRDVAIEYRWADDLSERLPTLAAELVRRRVSVIVTAGTPAALSAKGATATIPIIFVTAADPVLVGLVASLSQPDANITGVASLAVELGPKQLELLHELVPAATTIALLVNPTTPTNAETLTRELRTAARTFGLQLHVLNASTKRDFDTAFAALERLRAGALMIGTDPFFNSQSQQLAALAARHAVPTIYPFHEYAQAGGLMSYGTSFTAPYHQVGIYAGRILKGERPADLPVQQMTKIELIINLKTAKVLGLNIPPTLLARADEVIE
jgi:putative tryptophan/tyrosine transport system substrate-binding protein